MTDAREAAAGRVGGLDTRADPTDANIKSNLAQEGFERKAFGLEFEVAVPRL